MRCNSCGATIGISDVACPACRTPAFHLPSERHWHGPSALVVWLMVLMALTFLVSWLRSL